VQAVDGPAGEAEHGGQQGQRGAHHGQDGQDGADGQAVEVLLADQEQAEQGDDHRRPG